MKFKLDSNSKKWIESNIDVSPVLVFPSTLKTLKESLEEFMRKQKK